jgi:LysM repeat protein
MIKKHTWIGMLLVFVLVGMSPVFSLADRDLSRLAQEGTNLLKNPGFEGLVCAPDSEPGWCNDNWSNNSNHDGSFHDNIFTPQGWTTWWRKGGQYGQPEVKTIPNVHPFTGELPRIRSGNYAVQYFNFYELQDGGLYQVVKGLEPGATVQFSVYAHGYSCDDNEKIGYSCSDPWNQWFQVGIEPNGVKDPFSPSIIWSADQLAPDHYTLIGPVTAQVGETGKVCVYIRVQTKWGFEHQDAYWDDASLVVTAPGTPPTDTPAPLPPTATSGPSPTPRPTPTPRPDGATVHIVEAGDTLFGLALMYDVPTDQIRELNAGSIGPNDLLSIGQALVISLPSVPPTATPLPAPPTPEEAEPTPVPPTPEGASICVRAYHDRNGDTFQDEATEELLPNVEFTVADASGVVGRYTSDGISEPYCFTRLASGSYRVIQSSPPGYAPSGLAEQNVALAEGTSFDFRFGNVRSEAVAGPGETAEPTPANDVNSAPEDEGGSTFSRILATVAKIAGVLVLLLAAFIAVLFVLNQRRRY